MYDELAEIADELLKEFGQEVVIRRVMAGEYNPETGSATLTTVDQAGVGAVFDYGDRLIDGSMILSGDKQLFLSPVGIGAPTPEHKAIVGQDTYNIVRVKTTAPAGTAVLYECQLRK